MKHLVKYYIFIQIYVQWISWLSLFLDLSSSGPWIDSNIYDKVTIRPVFNGTVPSLDAVSRIF